MMASGKLPGGALALAASPRARRQALLGPQGLKA
jgi:hypothetical protein